MAVTIRLTRMGQKKRPFYRIVATDSQSPRDGRFLEILGYYDPTRNPANVKLHQERIAHWLKTGADASPTVANLLKKHMTATTAAS